MFGEEYLKLPNEELTPTNYLNLSSESQKFFEFRKINFTGDLTPVFKRELNPRDFVGSKIGSEFKSIFDQLRNQSVEYKTSVVLTFDGELLLQINPSRGNLDQVDNKSAQSGEGEKVFEVHNHTLPEIKEEGKTYAYFSNKDLSNFAYGIHSNIAEAVVFDEGSSIIIKTKETEDLIESMFNKLGGGKWARAVLANDISIKMGNEAPNDNDEERRNFSIQFANDHRMKLLFIPKGTEEIQILV